MEKSKSDLANEFINAVINGKIEDVKSLISQGVDTRYKNCMALVIASKSNNLDMLELLIKNEKTINSDIESTFLSAACNNKPKVLELILETYDCIHFNFNYSLIRAVENLCYEAVEILSKRCPNKTILNDRPFLSAVYRNNIEMAKILIKNGSDPNVKSKKIFNYIIERNRFDFLKKLLDTGAVKKETMVEVIFSEAIENQNREVINLIIDAGVDLKKVKSNVLYKAVFKDDIKTVKILLDNMGKDSYDINVALKIAARDNRLEIVKLLLENNADAGADNSNSLYLSIYNKNLEIAKLLINEDVDIFADKRIWEEALSDKNIFDILQTWIDKNINQVIEPVLNNDNFEYKDLIENLNDKGQNAFTLSALSGDKKTINKLLNIVKNNDMKVSSSDFLREDKLGYNFLNALNIHGNLNLLEDIDIWKDNSIELKKMIKIMPEDVKDKFDFDGLLSKVLKVKVKERKVKKMTFKDKKI